ncbi:hypothetical protein TCSYLVIO_000183 [Trypanosoma cruzi]|nr:hypothetical protein TCSYLVIO_000183 [Trypanosoma cruzi]
MLCLLRLSFPFYFQWQYPFFVFLLSYCFSVPSWAHGRSGRGVQQGIEAVVWQMTENSSAVAAGAVGGTVCAGRSKALFLKDDERFLFDFGGESAVDGATMTGRDSTSPASCAFACPHEGEGDDADRQVLRDGVDAELGVRGKVAVASLSAAEVRRFFDAALNAGSDVFLNMPLNEAVEKFQFGLQRYSEALSRHTRQEKQRRAVPRKRTRISSDDDDINSNNNNNTSSPKNAGGSFEGKRRTHK